MEGAASAAAAGWLASHRRAGAVAAGWLMQRGFDAYARVPNPPDTDDAPPVADSSWRDAAERLGVPFGPDITWQKLADAEAAASRQEHGSFWANTPLRGSLRRPQAAALAEALAHFTATPGRCWFGVWEGYLDSRPGPAVFTVADRAMALYVGDVGEAAAASGSQRHQSPTLWWPEGRAWLVATDIDSVSTFVGGSGPAIRAVIANGALESFAVPFERTTAGCP